VLCLYRKALKIGANCGGRERPPDQLGSLDIICAAFLACVCVVGRQATDVARRGQKRKRKEALSAFLFVCSWLCCVFALAPARRRGAASFFRHTFIEIKEKSALVIEFKRREQRKTSAQREKKNEISWATSSILIVSRMQAAGFVLSFAKCDPRLSANSYFP
jgi:hypothetical protein